MSLKEVTKDNGSRLLLLCWLLSGAFASCFPLPQQGWLRCVPIAQGSPPRPAEVFCGFIFVLLRLWELGLCQLLTPMSAFWGASPQENQKGEWCTQGTPFLSI